MVCCRVQNSSAVQFSIRTAFTLTETAGAIRRNTAFGKNRPKIAAPRAAGEA